MSPLFWRLIATLIVALLFIFKFFVLGPITQIPLEDITRQTAAFLAAQTSGTAVLSRQPRRADLQMFKFQLADCPTPYLAFQALEMEDEQALLNASANLHQGLEPHVIFLGDELKFNDRLGLKLTAIKKFITYRLGLSAARPAAYLYIVMAAPGCTGYKNLDWWRAWAS